MLNTSSSVPHGALHDLDTGDVLFDVGAANGFWQLHSGAMRLDSWNLDGPHFMQIVLPGDLLGLELLAAYAYRYSARAIVPCTVQRVVLATELDRRNLLIEGLLQQQRRVADLVALRTGTAQDRLKQLLLLLAPYEARPSVQALQCALPTIKDMAAILDVTPETVSRIMSNLKRIHALDSRERQGASFSATRLRDVVLPPGMTCSDKLQRLPLAAMA